MLAVWISGWGIPPEWLRPLASAGAAGMRLELLAPTPEAAQSAGTADRVVAWSFGAFRVLEALARGQSFSGQVYLLAPFISFAAEHGGGGRCTLTQLRWLKRWLQRDPAAALSDFYQRAGLSFPIPAPHEILSHWGSDLDVMMQDGGPVLAPRLAGGLPANFHLIIGERDPLLDAGRIATVLPGTWIVPGLGHDCGPLWKTLKEAHAL